MCHTNNKSGVRSCLTKIDLAGLNTVKILQVDILTSNTKFVHSNLLSKIVNVNKFLALDVAEVKLGFTNGVELKDFRVATDVRFKGGRGKWKQEQLNSRELFGERL